MSPPFRRSATAIARELAHARQRIEDHRVAIAALEEQAAVLEQALAMIRGLATSELHPGTELGTPLDMSIQAQTIPLKRPGRKLTSKGPVALAARKAKLRMVDIAERMGVDYNVVKAWNRRGNVPEAHRDAFADACKPAKS